MRCGDILRSVCRQLKPNDKLMEKFTKYYGKEGQQSIDPVVFFKLILIGNLENLNSDRRIISHFRLRLDILFFLCYDIDEELPWHSTIRRTRALYGEDLFQSVFQKILSLCVQKGMLGGKRQAVDSAYVKANASMDSLVEKEILEDVFRNTGISTSFVLSLAVIKTSVKTNGS